MAKGERIITYMDAYTAQYYVNMPEYQNLKMIPQSYEPRKICFGVAKAGDPQLLSILNKCINTISEEDSQAIINAIPCRSSPFPGEFPAGQPAGNRGVPGGLLPAGNRSAAALSAAPGQSRKAAGAGLEKHFRIYALVSEYFFEYDFQDGRLMVTLPQEGSKAEIVELDFSKPLPGRKDWGRDRGIPRSDPQRAGRRLGNGSRVIDGKPTGCASLLETTCGMEAGRCTPWAKSISSTGEKREKDTLQEKAQLDSLTLHLQCGGLPPAGHRSAWPGRRKTRGALLLLDRTISKEVNDTYGHLRGISPWKLWPGCCRPMRRGRYRGKARRG